MHTIEHTATVAENGKLRYEQGDLRIEIDSPELHVGGMVKITIEEKRRPLASYVGVAKRLGSKCFDSIEEVDAFINELRGEREE